MAHDQQILCGCGTLLYAVHEDGEGVFIGGMCEDFTCFTYGNPHDIVDFAYIRAMHGTECVKQMFRIISGNWLRHPIQRVLGVDGAIARMPGFLAFFGQWIFDFAQIRAEGDGNACLLADFSHCGMTMRFALLEFAFRPAPVIVLWSMHDAHFNAVELFFWRFLCCNCWIFSDFATGFPPPYNTPGGFYDTSHVLAHIFHCKW